MANVCVGVETKRVVFGSGCGVCVVAIVYKERGCLELDVVYCMCGCLKERDAFEL